MCRSCYNVFYGDLGYEILGWMGFVLVGPLTIDGLSKVGPKRVNNSLEKGVPECYALGLS